MLILVKSRRAGERVKASVTRYVTHELKLVVNEQKNRVVKTQDCEFSQLGVSMAYRFERLARYVRGWMNDFGISDDYRPIPEIDAWLRRYPGGATGAGPHARWCGGLGARHPRLLDSAVLCRAIPPWFACTLRLGFLPECFMRNAAPLSKSLSGCFQNGLQLWRVAHQQTLKVLFALGSKQNSDGLALARHDDRPFFGSLDIFWKVRANFFLRCSVHSSTSSSATNSLLPSFTPIA